MYNFYKFTKKDGIFHIYINNIFQMAAEEKTHGTEKAPCGKFMKN